MKRPDAIALFSKLYAAPTEEDVHGVLHEYRAVCEEPTSWHPLGGNDANMSIIQNQQGQPAAALVEKLTNAIDAVLMRRVLEAGIDPKGPKAPKSMSAAVSKFYKRLWQDKKTSDAQAYDIQLLAHGPKGASSLVIYDAGEGQTPEAFPETFLSLVKGNKKDIPFVQGMYNMGGTGSIVFCGRHKYQLICSRRYDGQSNAGFTLVRRHPLSKFEAGSRKTTWYEYLAPNGKILEFSVGDGVELGLRGRLFDTGSVIKLYSYALPTGLRGNIAQELFQSLSELLIEPALPVWVMDSASRYPDTAVLERALTGLRRSIEQKSNRLVERHLSFPLQGEYGKLGLDCYVFTALTAEKDVQKVRESIKRQFFQNGSAVLFTLNGQVQGAWTTQFITQSLSMPLLRDYLLVIVDCTGLHTEFRNDLFMASRDRLANSEQAQQLREALRGRLLNSELRDIHEMRKRSLGVQSASATRAIKSCVSALSLDVDLHALLAGQMDFDSPPPGQAGGAEGGKKGGGRQGGKAGPKPKETFKGRRFPTFFRLTRPSGSQESTPAAKIPAGSTRTIKFSTDVENEYFRRSRQPGRLDFTLLTVRSGDPADKPLERAKGKAKKIETQTLEDLVHIETSGPNDGEICISVKPKSSLAVGDAVQIAATLSGDLVPYNEFFWIRIVEPETRSKGKGEAEDGGPGFPPPVLIGRELREGSDVKLTWADAAGKGIGKLVDESLIVYPLMSDGRIECVFINMDSSVIEGQRVEGNRTVEQCRLLDNQYIATVYLHAVLLCCGMGAQGYSMMRPDPLEMGVSAQVDVSDFIADLFSDGYAEFLMRFGSTSLADLLEDV